MVEYTRKTCPECKGRGWIEKIDVYQRPCDACDGEGKMRRLTERNRTNG